MKKLKISIRQIVAYNTWRKQVVATAQQKKVLTANRIRNYENLRSTDKRLPPLHAEGINYQCPHHYKNNQKFTINLDKLMLGCIFRKKELTGFGVPVEMLGHDFSISCYRFLHTGHSSKQYKHIYNVYVNQDQVFTVQITPKNGKDDKVFHGVFVLENHLLYQNWYDILTQFASLAVDKYLRVSKCDIAVDGLNYVYNLLTDWAQDKTHEYAVKLIGKSKVNAFDINRTTRKANGYHVGTAHSGKQIAIYNKTKDIKRTGKKYISDFWKLNGLDIPVVFRYEMRLGDAFLKRLVCDFLPPNHTTTDLIESFRDTDKLLSIFYKATESFFEWIYCDNKNVTRCTRVMLLPPHSYNIIKMPLEHHGTPYKSKMQIHNTFYQVAKKIVGVDEGIAIIEKQMTVHDLHSWYQSRFPDFAKRYKPDNVSFPELSRLATIAPPDRVGNYMRSAAHLPEIPIAVTDVNLVPFRFDTQLAVKF